MKYIDAEKLIAEIAKLRKEHTTREYRDEAALVLDDLEDYIDSLQQEQPEVDLENELDEWVKYGPHTNYPWCTIPDAIKITAEHFYELGKNARKA